MSPTIKSILSAPNFNDACRIANNNKVSPTTLERWYCYFTRGDQDAGLRLYRVRWIGLHE